MMSDNSIPGWIRLWLLVSGLVCTWDGTFIIFRPHSLPGGKYHSIWKPYSKYISVDKRYGDMEDPFVYAQSLMNFVEIFFCFLVLVMNARNARSTATLAFSVSLMTMWKTVLYLVQYTELCGGGKYHSHNDPFTNFLYLWLPSGIWIILPLLVVGRLWGRLSGSSSGRQEEKAGDDIETSYKSNSRKAKKNR